MDTLSFLWQMVIHPRLASRALLQRASLRPALTVVVVFGLFMAAGYFLSHLQGDYPPPPADLQVWIEAWGEFTMLPFIKVPAESYRLAQALFILPLLLAAWMLMAGSARLLGLWFGSQTSFEQYAALFGFSFFSFWIAASLLDTLLSGVFGGFVLAAARGDHGASVRSAVVNFYPFMYTVLFGLGGVYNGLAAHTAGGLKPWQAALTGLATFCWPNLLAALLLR